jgi:hypothetical protein
MELWLSADIAQFWLLLIIFRLVGFQLLHDLGVAHFIIISFGQKAFLFALNL